MIGFSYEFPDYSKYIWLEHGSISVKIVCDRGVTHEIVRHRVASYSQESTRYCNYSAEKFGTEITVIKPCFWEETSTEYTIWKESMELLEKNQTDAEKRADYLKRYRMQVPFCFPSSTMCLRWRGLKKARWNVRKRREARSSSMTPCTPCFRK